ncbi:hypothetical protein HMPREF3038_02347 [Akkermansia sp. KLE1797]|nr:hypothetical protein HMPREF3038_02347 [Akkermansia sp. KLE1797]KZA03924.1 hypothetical protein HMPREF1326_02464 [Akkermansia sp. KLE1605]
MIQSRPGKRWNGDIYARKVFSLSFRENMPGREGIVLDFRSWRG